MRNVTVITSSPPWEAINVSTPFEVLNTTDSEVVEARLAELRNSPEFRGYVFSDYEVELVG